MKNILITDKVHDLLIEGLKAHGFLVDYSPSMSYDQVRKRVINYDGLVINSKVICDQEFLNHCHHLDFIGRLGSGLDIIDLEYAAKLGIQIISSPEGNANAVGEHVLGMLLTLLHHINRAHWDVRKREWNRESNRGTELKGKTVGIIGFGHTGPAFAQKLKCMGVQILVYDKYRNPNPTEYPGIELVSYSELLSNADIVSIHLPLTEETRMMVDEDFLAQMKRGAILINSSRGLIVRSAAVLKALNSGQLSGACLDVIENERPELWTVEEEKIYQDFLTSDRVVLTPHIAGWTQESLELIASVMLVKIRKFYKL